MRIKFPIWRHFLDGIPIYLARHYWWAYLWRPGIWFFDHQPIINAILFGQYRRLLAKTLECLEQRPAGRFLQLTCVYGKLTPTLLQNMKREPLYLADVAEVQLETCRSKLAAKKQCHLLPARMNAEHMAFTNNSFSTVLIFFLLCELPHDARQRVLQETLRVMQPGGRLVITEYGPFSHSHWLHRLWPTRWLLTYLEPFLDNFWHEDLHSSLQNKARTLGKNIHQIETHSVFNGFYRITVFELTA